MISRRQLMVTLGLAEPEAVSSGVIAFTEKLYDETARRVLEQGDEGPHQQVWHTSFHASQFPSTHKACGRQAMYKMLNVPEDRPTPGWLVAVSDAGKDLERQLVKRWDAAGVLLSESPENEWQTHFEDPDHWLTCSVDSILDPRSFSDHEFPLPVDIKGKDHDVVSRLRDGSKSPDLGHVRQIQVQAHFVRKHHDEFGSDGLGQCEGGVLLYASRARPLTQHEVYVELDHDFIEAGLDTLMHWKMFFEHDVLPDRPKSWRWTEEPCKWCNHKKVCKIDLRNDTDELSKSSAVSYARSVRPTYDPDAVREAVFTRWGKEQRGNDTRARGSGGGTAG